MRHRPLGKTGISVSPLVLGTVKFGRNTGVKYPSQFDLPSDTRCIELLQLAAARRINLIDTAPAYGTSEERLGLLLYEQPAPWILCTKAGEEFEGGRSHFDFSPGAIRRSVERSLRRLRTDRVDVLLLHSDGVVELDLDRGGTLDALRDLKRLGLARAVGVSVKTPEGAMRCIAALDVVMLTLNTLDRSFEPAIVEATERGVGVLLKKALASGHDPGGLAFAAGHRGVSSVVVGTIDPAHLAANCDRIEATEARGGDVSTPIP